VRFGTFSYNQRRPDVPEQQAFDELLDQIELTERLGFDEAWFAEHHHSDYGMLASPNLIIAALARRTAHLRFGNLVNVVALHDPIRLAEECAILDLITGGRLNVGLGRGVARDDVKHGFDMEVARARYEEGVDVMLRAWTGETFSHQGAAWTYADISCKPTPLQQPYPPIYYGATSPESPAMVARRGWNLALSRQPIENSARAAELYRTERAAVGNPATGGNVVLVRDVYVADSDEQAWAEAGPQITRFWQLGADNLWRNEALTLEDLPRFTARFAYFPGGLTREKAHDWGVSLIGSPETVIARARAMIDQVRPDSFVGMFGYGGLSHAQVTHSLELFASRVMPALTAAPVTAQTAG
jgi:alkanesulfonate monooxygenase SsuD/methylene tetrahydromethanopterin reductase-like flavin-dependent oxidoreductase (luciferase family)